jgi:hypothetical protein
MRHLRAGPKMVMATAVVGAGLYALTFFSLGFIAGTSEYWTEPFGDRITNLVGVLYYVRDNWRFPLFHVPQLGFPEGTNIVFTDSLPLLALALKLVHKATGAWSNYFGYWVFSCFLLLAAFTVLMLRSAKVHDPVAILVGVLLAISFPALLARLGHASLMGHFLIAWALYLYFRLRAAPCQVSTIGQFCALGAACVLLQAYFVLMVMPFFAAALVHAATERRCTVRHALFSAAAVAATLGTVTWIAGIVGPGGASPPAPGFGHYSMNLLSPFLPPREHLPAFMAGLVRWDRSGYTWDATGGQYEGYNYLGAGILLLLALAIGLAPRLVWQQLLRHWMLAICMTILVVLALSNRIFLGNRLLFEAEVPGVLTVVTGHFRTGGRLFWPVYYVLVVGLIALVISRFGTVNARRLLLLAAVLQVADTQLLRSNMAVHAASGHPQQLNKMAWTRLLEAHDFVEQYPSFQCGGWAGKWPENNANMELHLIAAQLSKPINSSYTARPVKNCPAEREKGLNFDVRHGGLYFFAGDFPLRRIAAKPHYSELCRQFQFGIACTRSWPEFAEHALAAKFGPAPQFPLPRYSYGDLLRFVPDGSGLSFMGDGWWTAESWGVWSAQPSAEVFMEVDVRAAHDLLLKVHATAFLHKARPQADVMVEANGRNIAHWRFLLGQGIVLQTARIPSNLIGADGSLNLRFKVSSPQSPLEAGLSKDGRQLGFGLTDLSVSPAS